MTGRPVNKARNPGPRRATPPTAMSSRKQQMAVAAEFEQDLHEAAEANADAAAAAYRKRALGGGHGLPFKRPKTARIVPCKSAPARHQRGEEDDPKDKTYEAGDDEGDEDKDEGQEEDEDEDEEAEGVNCLSDGWDRGALCVRVCVV